MALLVRQAQPGRKAFKEITARLARRVFKEFKAYKEFREYKVNKDPLDLLAQLVLLV